MHCPSAGGGVSLWIFQSSSLFQHDAFHISPKIKCPYFYHSKHESPTRSRNCSVHHTLPVVTAPPNRPWSRVRAPVDFWRLRKLLGHLGPLAARRSAASLWDVGRSQTPRNQVEFLEQAGKKSLKPGMVYTCSKIFKHLDTSLNIFIYTGWVRTLRQLLSHPYLV
jgi:hypothetical protein